MFSYPKNKWVFMSSTNWIGKNRRAIILLRVSSLGQEGNTSRITQKRECEEYCIRVGLELVEVIPIVESAKDSDHRKEYKKVVKKSEKSNIQHFVVHRYDRETRNLTDAEANEKLVRQGKIVLHYVVDGKVLHKSSPDSEFFNRDIHAAIDKNYSRDLSTKVRRGTKEKADSGWWPGCRPPGGYINQKLKSDRGFERRRGSIIVVDPDRATVRRVQREFELRAQKPTPSLREIRRKIIEEGLVPLDKAPRYRESMIEKHLKNIFYDGRYHWQGVEYLGKHERIIPSDLFWTVQATFGIKNPYGKNPDALFGNGWMKCGDPACGCFILYDPVPKLIKATGEKKIFKYYRCTNGRRIHPNMKGMRLSEEKIMEQFGGAVSQISIREDFRDELVVALNETQVKTRRAIQRDIESYEAALTSLETREDEIYKDLKAGVLDEEGYHRHVRRVREERARLTGLMKQAQLTINDVAGETVKSILQLATNAESLWKRRTPEEKRMFLNKLLSNPVLDGVTVRYEIVKPLQTLSEMKTDQKWRRVRGLKLLSHFKAISLRFLQVLTTRRFGL